ncbi:MAG: hypothetical protein EPN72_12375 [Nevskiaceae bacterium]|nr:MAG: hypothetical protein EPN63_00600 [Nevskiaceae bacterium]TBR72103.1 MAG: hypothetical protein EPN72_12375 [Nevskiaceae bacterium]
MRNELPVSRLRALGQLHELAAPDLMFSETEVAEFVGKVSGVQLTHDQVLQLRERTEGWAAILQMAGVALGGVGDVDQFLDHFSGEHESISDFLSEEVFQRQSVDLQNFLMVTSLLERFCSSLTDALMERRDGRRMIDEIERRNLPMFSLDPERHWYRYHHLFSDFLRRRLGDRHPERISSYHRRASAWLAEHELMIDAIEHAFRAFEVERAGELLDLVCGDLFAAGQTATLMSLSSRLPLRLLHSLPRLQLELAWHNELSWKFPKAGTALKHVRAALDERARATNGAYDPDTAFLETKFAHRVMMLALLSDDIPTTAELAQQWLRNDRTQDPFMCASAGSAVMLAHREMFRCEGVATSTRMLHDRFIEGGAYYGIVFHESIAGATFFARGDLVHAREAYETALQTAIELQGERSALYNMPALMLAELYYEQNRIQPAEDALAQRDITSELGFVDNLIAGFLTSARLLVLRGRAMEAETVLEEGDWLARRYRFQRMHMNLLDERVRLYLLSGRLEEAQALVGASPLCGPIHAPPDPREGATTIDQLFAMVVGRLMIAAGEAQGAAKQLQPWFEFTVQRHVYRAAIRVGVLLAHAQARAGDRRAAQRVLIECLRIGEPGWFVRSFVDEGHELLTLLRELETTPTQRGAAFSPEYLRAILGASEDPDQVDRARQASPDSSGIANQELLSQREIQILTLAARGNQNRDIAALLCLTESTVKWYWQRIFDKLDVRRRPDAIKRARHNQWIA